MPLGHFLPILLVVGEAVHETSGQVALVAGEHDPIEVVVPEEERAPGLQDAPGLGDQSFPAVHAFGYVLADYSVEDVVRERRCENLSSDESQSPVFDRGAIPLCGFIEGAARPIQADHLAFVSDRVKQRSE